MAKLLVCVLMAMSTFVAGHGFAGDKTGETSTTTWVNDQGNEVRGNWTTGEIVEIRTVEEYYWHRDHYDPAAHYEVAPWLYDPFNLSRESGGDESRD